MVSWSRWIPSGPGFFLQVRFITSRLFSGKLLNALDRATAKEQLRFGDSTEVLSEAAQSNGVARRQLHFPIPLPQFDMLPEAISENRTLGMRSMLPQMGGLGVSPRGLRPLRGARDASSRPKGRGPAGAPPAGGGLLAPPITTRFC